MLPQIRIIIWLVLICVGAVAGFSVGRYALPKCIDDKPTTGTTADKITEYENIRDPVTGKIIKKIKRVLDKPRIETHKEKIIAPDWKTGILINPLNINQMGTNIEYKLYSNVFSTEANLYVTTGIMFDRDDNTLWPTIGVSFSF